jgi:hypothetical protein
MKFRQLLYIGCEKYVIVQELPHSSVPNHGKLRKSRMIAHLGDHA